jgi:hypothetical protein
MTATIVEPCPAVKPAASFCHRKVVVSKADDHPATGHWFLEPET